MEQRRGDIILVHDFFHMHILATERVENVTSTVYVTSLGCAGKDQLGICKGFYVGCDRKGESPDIQDLSGAVECVVDGVCGAVDGLDQRVIVAKIPVVRGFTDVAVSFPVEGDDLPLVL